MEENRILLNELNGQLVGALGDYGFVKSDEGLCQREDRQLRYSIRVIEDQEPKAGDRWSKLDVRIALEGDKQIELYSGQASINGTPMEVMDYVIERVKPGLEKALGIQSIAPPLSQRELDERYAQEYADRGV